VTIPDPFPTCRRLVRRVYRTADDAAGGMVFASGPAMPCGGTVVAGVCARCGREG
jgi:hypothetical protein